MSGFHHSCVSKYKAIRTENRDGTISDSRKEAKWDAQLMLLAKNFGLDIRRKERFSLEVNGNKICSYEADWTIYKQRVMVPYINRIATIDCKGFKTPVYKIKKKLFEALYNEPIIEDLNEAIGIMQANK